MTVCDSCLQLCEGLGPICYTCEEEIEEMLEKEVEWDDED
jgi:hypothetical protein